MHIIHTRFIYWQSISHPSKVHFIIRDWNKKIIRCVPNFNERILHVYSTLRCGWKQINRAFLRHDARTAHRRLIHIGNLLLSKNISKPSMSQSQSQHDCLKIDFIQCTITSSTCTIDPMVLLYPEWVNKINIIVSFHFNYRKTINAMPIETNSLLIGNSKHKWTFHMNIEHRYSGTPSMKKPPFFISLTVCICLYI